MDAAQVIAKKDLTDWKKWEFGALDAFRSMQKNEVVEPSTPKPAKTTQNSNTSSRQGAVILPTAEQIEIIYQQARDEGTQAGYLAGKEQAAQESVTERQRLHLLISTFEQELVKIDQTIAQDILILVMDLARKMVGQTIQAKPELVLSVIETALRQLPITTQPLRLKLHPQDAVLVREHFVSQSAHLKWEITEDGQIEPGGCQVESGGCEVDATLPTRWQRTLASLGQEQAWLI
ncbi:MAG: flagellar assembly protein FliH [Nitrosomonas sp.]|jgi:flagellar assembly protein FliH|nr:flagellar assembly protein FliH [Nitrosomonas sp.]